MADWTTFAGFAGVVLALLLLLAHASQGQFRERSPSAEPLDRTESRSRPRSQTDRDPAVAGGATGRADDGVGVGNRSGADGADAFVYPFADGPHSTRRRTDEAEFDDAPSARPELSTGALLLNVAVSQGLFASLLVAGALYAEIPASAFGITPASLAPATLLAGVALGVALYGANELGATVGRRFGLGGGEELRAALAPDSTVGWAALLLLVLPVIAGFEELLFRGVLVGVLSAGFGVSPWLLAVVSSVLFALGHGAQGPTGVAVTGLLGFALAVGYVLTGSLAAVVVAHYLVNALEFVVHEGLDPDSFGNGRGPPE